MQTIGLLSDTHGWWDEKYATYFASCDEIWHAGDIGSADVALQLSAIRPLRAVCGNIDGYPVRQMYPKTLHFTIEDVSVMMTHIGGYPGRYEPAIRAELYETKPQLFVCGHSHILKVMFDKRLNCLCLNPGAAGKSGFHTVRTLMRFVIDGADIRDMEIIELAKR
ncbi:metallophosphoesterase family protein [Tannerella forsythia]|uniref:Metallophosphoesterase n=1 Tax=Tannerella forsythia TaxID=28112 RepID=A0A3P1YWJ4_TANFO|nr:metallophosphoesterase family protein [Tannerella forsythia]RRD75412.1 metallophosphoesterase [Tannerella forsythia]